MMNHNLLLKGFEVELFTGLITGEHFGVSDSVVKALKNFVQEPDKRNIEYITPPYSEYHCLKNELILPRKKVREWLSQRNLTLLPGSTLSLGNSKEFIRSDKSNLYHEFIQNNYWSSVVTTSIHINLGINDLSLLFLANRLVRCEAALFLSLSASSPFLDGLATGAHSQRWLQFPLTPKNVPIFIDHNHYVKWIENKLANGEMMNERHLWSSVRPNGPKRPYLLDRLELRICDLITNFDLLLAITALLELRVLSLFKNPTKLDPLIGSKLSVKELEKLSTQNDEAAAKGSLNATLFNWSDGKPITSRDWLKQLLEDVRPMAIEMNMVQTLKPIDEVLNQGNQAMKWLDSFHKGKSIKTIIQEGINNMEKEEVMTIKPEAILG